MTAFILRILDPDIAFDGWAIAIIIFILSCLGFGTYKFVTKSKINQKQKGGNDSEQEQTINPSTIKDTNEINQSQKAGDNAKQKQTV